MLGGQFHAPVILTPKETAPGTYWIGGWVGPRVSLDVVAKRKKSQLGIEPWSPIPQPSHYND
jgi:hypothetical protein